MQILKLHKKFDELQKKFGDSNLNAIYGTGCVKNPEIFLIFMNPTARNIASDKNWNGLRAQWLGTKNIWSFLTKLNLFDKNLNSKIQNIKSREWTPELAIDVYKNIRKKKIYITNLSKATQIDARALPNAVFQKYLPLLKQEISITKSKIIISFGNQVSSILLDKEIKVSEYRKQYFDLEIENKTHKIFPVYYPVGQGIRNISLVTEDIKWILNNF
jgi:hypothetical protein